MRIVVFGVVPHSPHFETQLELMEKHLLAGDSVSYVSCDRALSHCDANPENDRLFCRACEGKRVRGLGYLSRPVDVQKLSFLLDARDAAGVAVEFPDLEALTAYRVADYDCGEAVSSSLQSVARTIYPHLDAYRNYIARAMVSSVLLHAAAARYLKLARPDLVYIFNGRAATARGLLRACQGEKIRFYTHERGSSIDSYMLAENTVPHDVDYRGAEIRQHWAENPNTAEKEEVAARFYANMRRGKLAYREANYLKHQQSGCLPPYWTEGSERIVFFSSTETERAALKGFYQRRIYTSLIDMVSRILVDLKKSGFKGVFVLRMHPNSHEEYAMMLPRLAELNPGEFFHVIPPNEKVDTYALLDSADKVLVATSTLGMEAAYAGVPCISLERSNYDKLGSTYSPATHEEVMDLLGQPLLPKDKLGAIMYGYYTLTFGYRFKRVTMQGQNKCSFNGKKVRSPKWLDWAMKLRKRLNG